MKRIIGIDPGATGAIALWACGTLEGIEDMPVTGDKRPRIDCAAVGLLLRKLGAEHAFVERVGSMPKQGVASTFQFGMACGIVLGAVGALAIPCTLVHPAAWKSALRVPAAKHGARVRASQLIPDGAAWWQRAKDHGRAEAALIGLYGLRLNGQSAVEW